MLPGQTGLCPRRSRGALHSPPPWRVSHSETSAFLVKTRLGGRRDKAFFFVEDTGPSALGAQESMPSGLVLKEGVLWIETRVFHVKQTA